MIFSLNQNTPYLFQEIEKGEKFANVTLHKMAFKAWQHRTNLLTISYFWFKPNYKDPKMLDRQYLSVPVN